MKFLTSSKKMDFLITLACSLMISACGGQPESVTTAQNAETSQPGTTSAASASFVTPDIKIENTGTAAQSNVPVTFGQVFAQGTFYPSNSLIGRLSNTSHLPLQLDVKATHADGSIRHAVISAVLPSLPLNQTQTIQLAPSFASQPQPASTPTDLINAGFTASVNINLGGQIYTASADALLKAGKYTTWLAGSVANEWLMSAPLKTAAGAEHPHLTARFAIRSYTGLNKARVDVTIENNWAYEPGPQNFTYDAEVVVGGQTVYSKPALTHFYRARWRKTFWWGMAPQAHIKHNATYLMASKAVPNYDPSIIVSASALNSLNINWSTAKTEPMGPGIIVTAMPTTGGRPDIGPLPQWAAMYVLSMDSRAKNVTLGVGDLAGSWPIHYRDKRTDRPVSLIDYPYMTRLGRPSDAINKSTGKSELFPACGGDCSTAPYNYNPDSSHQPSMAYLPYIVTGDYYYLEELQFWANWNMVQANPYYRDLSKGLLRWDQVRGQAWSLRTLAQAAFITPDGHPMKQYFVDRVHYNLDWYNKTYTTNNPNQLGVLDGSGEQNYFSTIVYRVPVGVPDSTGIAPWQDDFFTWSVGYLAELGFSNAQPLLAWKAKFSVGRMTIPDYCWTDGATYALAIRPNNSSPIYSTFGEAYRATMRMASGAPLTNSTGARYLDQSCGSQEQADWRTQKDKDNKAVRSPWMPGEMDGYSTSPVGYPSNMQPALAVAAASGIPNAQAAWDIFMKRAAKPNYTGQPQWAIVPRK